jgi:hypothetical protein
MCPEVPRPIKLKSLGFSQSFLFAGLIRAFIVFMSSLNSQEDFQTYLSLCYGITWRLTLVNILHKQGSVCMWTHV